MSRGKFYFVDLNSVEEILTTSSEENRILTEL